MSRRVVDDIVIADPLGIHARPAAALAIAVAKSGARVTLRFGGKSADAKSLVQLLSLGAGPRSIVTAEVEGEEASIEAALTALRAHLSLKAAEAAPNDQY